MNIITIFYKRRDPGKFFELMAVLDESAIRQRWDNANSTYKIFWEWPQKEDVLNLLTFLKETFLDARIAIENDVEEETVATPEENTVKIQDVQKEDIIETADDNGDETSEPKEESDNKKEEENLCEENVNPYEEESSEVEEFSKANEENKNETTQEVIEITDIKEEEEKEILAISENVVDEIIPEAKSEEIPEENQTKGETLVEKPTEAKEVKSEETPTEEIKKVTLNPDDELKRILTPYFEKYNFDEKFCDSAEKFCADQGIRSEAFRRFFALAKTAPNISKLYAGVTRITKQNSALVKIEIKNNFEKFLKSIEPEIFDKCPEITITNFLNVFREENRKF